MKPVPFYSQDFSDAMVSIANQTYTCFTKQKRRRVKPSISMYATLVFEKDDEYVKEEYADLFVYDKDTECHKHMHSEAQHNKRISDTAVNIIHALENIDSKNLDDSIIGLAYAAHRDRVAITEPMSASIASRRLYDAIYAKWDVLHSLQFKANALIPCLTFEACQCVAISDRPENVNGIRLLLSYSNNSVYLTNACFAVDMLNVSSAKYTSSTYVYQSANVYKSGYILDSYHMKRMTCGVWGLVNQNTNPTLSRALDWSRSHKQASTQHTVSVWGIVASLSISVSLLYCATKPWISKTYIYKAACTRCTGLIYSISQACSRCIYNTSTHGHVEVATCDIEHEDNTQEEQADTV